MKIAFLPIDDRPVCYTLPKIISEIGSDINFFIPPREFLGNLKKIANIKNIINWLQDLPSLDAIILSLDTIAYGGLIPSRRSEETFEQIKLRIEKLKEILKTKQAKIYAFSSIMRISNNNYNEEEKEYWDIYGKQIFEYSYNLHKFGRAKTGVPKEILDDYLKTRKRNFEINKIYLEWQKEGMFESLIFSKDDCAQYGLNVQEAQELENMGGYVKTGADEIPLTLLARAINPDDGSIVKICPIYTEPDYKNLISNYEDISIENSVNGQIELAGCRIANYEDADIILYVNNFKKHQGEIVMKKDTEKFNKEFPQPQKRYMVADVRFANGADNNFVREILKSRIEDEKFYGYCGWNTSANTLGSLICGAKYKFISEKNNKYNKNYFDKLQVTRFLDDWGYQANVRQSLEGPDLIKLKHLMKFYENIIFEKYGFSMNVEYNFPWDRLFEVEIELN